MRKIYIDLTENRVQSPSVFIGYIGEHNATEMLITVEQELVSSSDYLVAVFKSGPVLYRSRKIYADSDMNGTYRDGNCIHAKLGRYLTNEQCFGLQVEGYSLDADGKPLLIGKSAYLSRLFLMPSPDGTNAVGFDGSFEDIEKAIDESHTHSNLDALEKLTLDEYGNIDFGCTAGTIKTYATPADLPETAEAGDIAYVLSAQESNALCNVTVPYSENRPIAYITFAEGADMWNGCPVIIRNPESEETYHDGFSFMTDGSRINCSLMVLNGHKYLTVATEQDDESVPMTAYVCADTDTCLETIMSESEVDPAESQHPMDANKWYKAIAVMDEETEQIGISSFEQSPPPEYLNVVLDFSSAECNPLSFDRHIIQQQLFAMRTKEPAVLGKGTYCYDGESWQWQNKSSVSLFSDIDSSFAVGSIVSVVAEPNNAPADSSRTIGFSDYGLSMIPSRPDNFVIPGGLEPSEPVWEITLQNANNEHLRVLNKKANRLLSYDPRNSYATRFIYVYADETDIDYQTDLCLNFAGTVTLSHGWYMTHGYESDGIEIYSVNRPGLLFSELLGVETSSLANVNSWSCRGNYGATLATIAPVKEMWNTPLRCADRVIMNSVFPVNEVYLITPTGSVKIVGDSNIKFEPTDWEK